MYLVAETFYFGWEASLLIFIIFVAVLCFCVSLYEDAERQSWTTKKSGLVVFMGICQFFIVVLTFVVTIAVGNRTGYSEVSEYHLSAQEQDRVLSYLAGEPIDLDCPYPFSAQYPKFFDLDSGYSINWPETLGVWFPEADSDQILEYQCMIENPRFYYRAP